MYPTMEISEFVTELSVQVSVRVITAADVLLAIIHSSEFFGNRERTLRERS